MLQLNFNFNSILALQKGKTMREAKFQQHKTLLDRCFFFSFISIGVHQDYSQTLKSIDVVKVFFYPNLGSTNTQIALSLPNLVSVFD